MVGACATAIGAKYVAAPWAAAALATSAAFNINRSEKL